MLKNKKFILISCASIVTAVFAALLFVLFKPIKMNANEADAPESMQMTDEADAPESMQMTDEISETDDMEPEQEAEKIPGDTRKEQKKYIGRQPPEGYVEPTYLDDIRLDYRGDEEYLEFYNEINKKYIEQGIKFESNIVVIGEDIRTEFEDYEWFKCPDEIAFGDYYNDFMWAAYAILTYYDGNVPCDYYVTADSVYNEAYKACEVQTYGERPLNIRLDKFNNRIRVEEGIKKEDRHIELAVRRFQLAIGEEFLLEAKVVSKHPEDHQIIWSSDDDTIATVSDDGMVKGISEGVTCLIVSTLSSELSKFALVTVVAP